MECTAPSSTKGYVYLTDDATGSMRGHRPARSVSTRSQVARWQTPALTEAGRTACMTSMSRTGWPTCLYWNDGLVILDVGNGVKGGSPENPQLVSQYKYDLKCTLPRSRSGRRPRVYPWHPHRLARGQVCVCR